MGDVRLGHDVAVVADDRLAERRQRCQCEKSQKSQTGTREERAEMLQYPVVGRSLSRDDMQAKSRAYATEQIALQMADFKRLGVLGDWERPYRTMDPANEAGQIRAFKRVIERGFVYRGLKPVYWCFDCGSSLAEFEIEYADKKSDTLDVAFESDDPVALARAFGLDALPDGSQAFAVIWTTTPWTLPSNQAVAVNPDVTYVDVAAPDKAPESMAYAGKRPGTQPIVARTFSTQPPVIPHAVENFDEVTLAENQCLDCHGAENYVKKNAPKLGDSHLVAATKAFDPSRHNCTQCHVPQVDAPALVENRFVGNLKQ